MNTQHYVDELAVCYNRRFYEAHEAGSHRSAQQIIPIVLSLVRADSVVDIGCGLGTWLAVVREYGIEDIVGLDGPYLDRMQLEIPQEKFRPYDLTQSVQLGRTFDLAISLEVAEHLPAKYGPAFVTSLANLAPVILFSAAIPGQGGTNHVNERWQDYWADLFHAEGYVVIDAVRPLIWNDPQIEWYYRQNVLIFVRKEVLPHYPALQICGERTHQAQLALVHPMCFEHHMNVFTQYYVPRWSARQLLRALLEAIRFAIQRRAREGKRKLRVRRGVG